VLSDLSPEESVMNHPSAVLRFPTLSEMRLRLLDTSGS
jgi:hypothetical protein